MTEPNWNIVAGHLEILGKTKSDEAKKARTEGAPYAALVKEEAAGVLLAISTAIKFGMLP